LPLGRKAAVPAISFTVIEEEGGVSVARCEVTEDNTILLNLIESSEERYLYTWYLKRIQSFSCRTIYRRAFPCSLSTVTGWNEPGRASLAYS